MNHNLWLIIDDETRWKDEGYYATHGWDNKYEEMHVPLTLYGPAFNEKADATKIGSVQNIEIYKLVLNLVGIQENSANLNETVMSQQFSEFGKFSTLMKNPDKHHKPISSATEGHRPELPEGELQSAKIDYSRESK